MINRDFFEQVAASWSKKAEIIIPDISDEPDIPNDFLNLDEVEDWDAICQDIFSNDIDDSMDFGNW